MNVCPSGSLPGSYLLRVADENDNRLLGTCAKRGALHRDDDVGVLAGRIKCGHISAFNPCP